MKDDFDLRAFRATAGLTVATLPLTWASSLGSAAVDAAWLIFMTALLARREAMDATPSNGIGFLVGLFAMMLLPQSCVEDVRRYAHGYRPCDERCEPFDGHDRGGRCLCERATVQKFAPLDGYGP